MAQVARLVCDGPDVWWMMANDEQVRISVFITAGSQQDIHWEVKGAWRDRWTTPPMGARASWPAIRFLREIPEIQLFPPEQAPTAHRLAGTVGRQGQRLVAYTGQLGQVVLQAGGQPADEVAVQDQIYVLLGKAVVRQQQVELAAVALEWERQSLPSEPTTGQPGRRQLHIAQQLLGELGHLGVR
jgi:hypothetical protein